MGTKRKAGTLPVLAAVVAGTAVATLGLVGIVASQTDDAPVSTHTQVAQPAATEGWAARAATTYATWAGSPAEQRASEVLAAYELNGAYSACMSDRGHPRPWQDTIVPPPTYKDPLLPSFWAADRLDGYYAQKVINGEIGQRIEQAANTTTGGQAEAEAEAACRAEHPAASDAAVAAIRAPELVTELDGAWAEALAPVLVAGGDITTYDTCMTASGALEELDVRSTEQARSLLSSLMPVGTVPLGDERTTDRWKAYLEDETAFVEADWGCREAVRSELADEVTEAVQAFVATHADSIRRARDHWDNVASRAAELE